MKKSIKMLVAAISVTMLTGFVSGCGSKADTTTKLSGTVLSLGSTALQPLAESASKTFMEKNPDVSVTVQGGGSGTGINQVASGNCQIGNSDVESKTKVTDEAVLKTLVDNKVCAIGFAMVVNSDVTINSLTVDQIKDIFTGKITNWKQVGGADEAINVVNRAKSSGTRGSFKATILGSVDEKDGLGITQESNGSVKIAVESTKGAISYLALSYLTTEKTNLKVLKINGVEAKTETITGNTYPFWSYEYMVTKGEAKEAVKGFIDYIKSDDFKPTIEKLGYIPMSAFK